jgi:hypothetical protein
MANKIRAKILANVILVLSTQTSVGSQSTAPQFTREQADFAMEAGLNHPVNVPSDVLAALKKSALFLTCLEKDLSEEDVRGDWFAGSSIHLGNSGNGIVVLPRTLPTATQPCLLHARSMPFWVFAKTYNV